jgi:methyl-accepting chemotaxis protein
MGLKKRQGESTSERKEAKEEKAVKMPKASKKAEKQKKEKKQKKPRKRIWTFSKRLMAMCLIPMIVVCVLVSILSTTTLKKMIEDEIENSMKIVAASVNETYTNLYEGDYKQDKSGALRKGETKISGNHDLVDALKEKTGFSVSMMYGNMRLVTSVCKDNGARANGTGIDSDVYDRVAAGETVFLDDTEVSDVESYALYEPLINSDGSVIGAIEVVTDSAGVKQSISEQVRRIVIYSLIFAVVAGIIVWAVSRTMVSRMDRIKRFLERLISGRLDHKPHEGNLKVNDEIGDIYRNCVKVQDTFNDMVSEIKTSCDNLKNAADKFSDMAQTTTVEAGEVMTAVEEIADGAKSQADSTVAAHENVAMISRQIELIMKEIDYIAESAADMAGKEEKSEAIIKELAASNDQTKNSVDRVAEQISLMNEAVANIKDAVGIIQSIADETDLLSLNASIEAARAGAAGRGFAVVAEQICKLALQSNESGQDIERILGEITATSKKMVSDMEEVRQNMDMQQMKLEETRATYKAVSDGVEQSLGNIGSIKEKIDVLSDSGNSISNAIEGLSAVSEQNAGSAANTMRVAENMSGNMQDVEASAEELLQLADKLQEALGSFQV